MGHECLGAKPQHHHIVLLTELKLEGPKPQQEREKKIPKAKG